MNYAWSFFSTLLNFYIQHSQCPLSFLVTNSCLQPAMPPFSPVLTCLNLLHENTESLRNIDRNLGLKCF